MKNSTKCLSPFWYLFDVVIDKMQAGGRAAFGRMKFPPAAQRIMDLQDLKYQVVRAKSGEVFLQTDLRVLFLLEGEMTVRYQGDEIPMQHADILLISPGMNYETHKVRDALYGLAVFPLALTMQMTGHQNMILYANSAGDPVRSYQDLRDILTDLTVEYTAHSHQTPAWTASLLLRLLDVLIEHYQLTAGAAGGENSQDDLRMRQIMQYVITHIGDDISLTQLADSMYLSTSTLSRLFHKNTGTYFANYVMQLRVQSAMGQLQHSGQSLTQIAMNCGFSNSAAFNRAFRKVCGMTPTDYKAKVHAQSQEKQQEKEAQERLIREELRQKGYEQARHGSRESVEIDLAQCKPVPYQKVWNRVINIGSLFELTRANVQFHVLQLQEQLHFQYIRVWNIFSRKVQVSDGVSLGQYNFSVINDAMDFLVQHHLKPFLDLGRRPDMAIRSDGKTIYYKEEYITYRSRTLWEDQIRQFLLEMVQRYGEEEVSTWIFELTRGSIHEPEHTTLYEDPDYDFLEGWQSVYRLVREYVPGAMVGGTGSVIDEEEGFLEAFFPKCVAKNCVPDFVSMVLFPYELAAGSRAAAAQQETGAAQNPGTKAGNAAWPAPANAMIEGDRVHRMKALMTRCGIGDRPLFITEWNNSISNRNFLNDSCFRSAYFAWATQEIWGETKLTAVMSGTDWISTYIDTKGIVNGGIGLLTRDSIRKPAFYAIDFMNQLGPLFLSRGRHFIATRKENGQVYILCFYFSWFRRSSIMTGDDIDLQKIQQVRFEDEEPLQLTLSLPGLERREYCIKKRSISRESGSILDEWAKFGFEERISREDVKHLQHSSEPSIYLEKKYAEGGRLEISLQLQPQEVVLLHIYGK